MLMRQRKNKCLDYRIAITFQYLHEYRIPVFSCERLIMDYVSFDPILRQIS